MAELWNDPQFQKEFTASYGTLAGYEPPISEEEKSTLRTLIKVIKARPDEAIKQLAPQIKSDDSARSDPRVFCSIRRSRGSARFL